jgi:hypothetical protein
MEPDVGLIRKYAYFSRTTLYFGSVVKIWSGDPFPFQTFLLIKLQRCEQFNAKHAESHLES